MGGLETRFSFLKSEDCRKPYKKDLNKRHFFIIQQKVCVGK